ncbi:MAG: hypothetical protein O3A81_04140 [bacterium]|nr:hypothetical protein [bacterium]
MQFRNHPERLFILIVGGLWILLIGVDRLAPIVLPTETLYFRAWEYVRGQHGLPRTNLTFNVPRAHGDLSNMLNVSSYKVLRDITFTVDSNGLRNTERSMEGSTVLVGQSFIAGAGNSDEDTPGTALAKTIGKPVFVYAPANMSQLLRELPDQKPQNVVWGVVERNLTGDNGEIQLLLNMNCPESKTTKTLKQDIVILVKKILLEPTTYARTSVVKKLGQRIYNEMYFSITHKPASPHIEMAAQPSKFIFLKKGVRISHENRATRRLDDVEKAIIKTADCLRSHNVSLVFVPIPDKVHVYNHLLPEKLQADYQRDPLLQLIHNVQAVDILTTFLKHISEKEDLLYWPDDTHWNALGIEKAMNEVAKNL